MSAPVKPAAALTSVVVAGLLSVLPLDRTRLVLSTPEIIKRINEAPACGRVSMDEAIRTASIKLPKGATHVKNSSLLKEGTALRPLAGPSFTCCGTSPIPPLEPIACALPSLQFHPVVCVPAATASRALSFCDAAGTTALSMRPEHTRALMGLPTTFKLSGVQRIDQRVLGVRLLVNQTKTDTLPLYLESTERCLDPRPPLIAERALLRAGARNLPRRPGAGDHASLPDGRSRVERRARSTAYRGTQTLERLGRRRGAHTLHMQ